MKTTRPGYAWFFYALYEGESLLAKMRHSILKRRQAPGHSLTGGLILFLWRIDKDFQVNLRILSNHFILKPIKNVKGKFSIPGNNKAF
jgi:hypothetical protein